MIIQYHVATDARDDPSTADIYNDWHELVKTARKYGTLATLSNYEYYESTQVSPEDVQMYIETVVREENEQAIRVRRMELTNQLEDI